MAASTVSPIVIRILFGFIGTMFTLVGAVFLLTRASIPFGAGALILGFGALFMAISGRGTSGWTPTTASGRHIGVGGNDGSDTWHIGS